jgi:hypothetical protein
MLTYLPLCFDLHPHLTTYLTSIQHFQIIVYEFSKKLE